METLKVKASIDSKGRLKLDIPTALRKGEVEIVMVVEYSDDKAVPVRYDFSDIAGKLKWSGNALQAQKALRDEW
jgi:hypothetical protein